MGQSNLELRILPSPPPRKPLLKMGTPRARQCSHLPSGSQAHACLRAWTASSLFKAKLRALLSRCEAHSVSVAGLSYSFLKHRGIIAQFYFHLCWLVRPCPGTVQGGWELREVPKDLPGCALECGLEGFSSAHCQALSLRGLLLYAPVFIQEMLIECPRWGSWFYSADLISQGQI